MNKYEELSKIFKTLCEPIRLQILDILSCGEMCACKILEDLSISQSTLSHHMKVLINSGLVKSRKAATWMHYSINRENIEKLYVSIEDMTSQKENYICQKTDNSCRKTQL